MQRGNEPTFAIDRAGEAVRLTLTGSWTIDASRTLEAQSAALLPAVQGARLVAIDLGIIQRLDTAGAWLINGLRQNLSDAGVAEQLERISPDQKLLLEEAAHRSFERPAPKPTNAAVDMLADIGASIVHAGRDSLHGVSFLGETMLGIGRAFTKPARFRITSLVYHLESFGLRSVPIIALINFLVGGIVAQQGIFQLRYFGAETFAVDLIGILILRELGVLLTCIMIAGRSGSAITAELGSMKMREEIDALQVMGLSPIDVLIVPRILALVIALPLLTFLADMSAIFGGLLVTWSYAGLSPDAFVSRLQTAISFNTFMVGMIKAPFMALVIGLIGALEGLNVKGSAESLGRQVTSSVVKSIFMVIVVDGLFAIFFAAIKY